MSMWACGCRVHTVGMGGWIDLCERHAVIERARQKVNDQVLTKQAQSAYAILAHLDDGADIANGYNDEETT